VNLHFVSNKSYSLFQNRSAVLKLFFTYHLNTIRQVYVPPTCGVVMSDERESCCVEKLCFIICNLYYNAWIAYHLKMLHVPPVVRVPQFENR
jgi:hypothetical protein